MNETSYVSPAPTREPSQRNSSVVRPEAVLIVLWIATTAIVTLLLLLVPDRQGPRLIVELLFVAYLVWYLARTGPKSAELPDLQSLHLPWFGFWGRLAVILVLLGLVYLSGVVSHPFLNLTLLFLLTAIGILVVWFRRLSGRLTILALAAATVVGFSEYLRIIPIPAMPAGYLAGKLLEVFIWIIIVIPLFLAGGLLLQQTGLARVRFLEGEISLGIRSFLFACILALPGALANLGAPTSFDPWVDRWWKPFNALTPGIGEETWARLFLTTLCYAILRPVTNNKPRRAVLAAVLIGVFTHMAVHVPTMELFSRDGLLLLFDGVVYGIPIAVLFVKRDFEQAVGYHFFVDFVRFLAALIK